ncbi:response regulator transcription factor [Nitrosomonas sp. PY1]|uniref:LuxR C-terminal-related transcriptional regulator n=1 Tax=Nitrosomonas sp. PY1 TaxID=1803906 RepID=UPI001FC7D403|nr:response regulator transcription factor [Nitrosomonas sp. PY1]
MSKIAFLNSYNTFSVLKKNLQQLNPQLILIDCELPGFMGYQSIQELLAISKQAKIVLFGPNLSDEVEWGFFKAGIKGYCPGKISTEQLNKVISAILQGELWIRRTLTHRILDELIKTTHEEKRTKQFIQNAIASLTHRENEIALLVAQGESNKDIAYRLAITERTVKAHLTEIFKKMQVTDRIKVALIIKDLIQSR